MNDEDKKLQEIRTAIENSRRLEQQLRDEIAKADKILAKGQDVSRLSEIERARLEEVKKQRQRMVTHLQQQAAAREELEGITPQ